MKVHRGREKLVIEVSDHDPRVPEPREPDLVDGTGGFGMYPVASLSSNFEAKSAPDGETMRDLARPGDVMPAQLSAHTPRSRAIGSADAALLRR